MNFFLFPLSFSSLSLRHILRSLPQPHPHAHTHTSLKIIYPSVRSSGTFDFNLLHYKASSIPLSSKLLCDTLITPETPREELMSIVKDEVASVELIDLHTHLLPTAHHDLHLKGIDDLLTYHYLVSEYFMTSPSRITPEVLYAMTKQKQAEIIWKALFVDRTPISESCRGLCTLLQALGLGDLLREKDLEGIRGWYDKWRGKEREYEEMIFAKAGVKYAIMTNIPFDENEARHWKPDSKPYSSRYRSALRVDPLLAGDVKSLSVALALGGYPETLEGARSYLRDWCDTIKPEYMMASTPKKFRVDESPVRGPRPIDENTAKVPGAFASAISGDCCEDDSGSMLPSVIDESSDLLSEVLIKVCEEKNLPLALKIGCERGVNASLKAAGDGVVSFADTSCLARLCLRFPKVKFLATFLSLNNQHEACVLASKFPNLHLYGCWWFVNNPSMISSITTMRVEMLGTAFTFQHSDCRVLDQLLYKWPHSRGILAKVLFEEVRKMVESGCKYTRQDLRRDIGLLTGDSYEYFISNS